MMRTNSYYLIMLLSLSGCGLLKDTSKSVDADHVSLEEQMALKLSVDAVQGQKASVLTLYSDSANEDYSVQFWPKGHFTFSAANGFEGEAEKVLISGKTQRVGAGSTLSNLEEVAQTSTQLNVDQLDKLISDQKLTVKKSTVSLKVVLTGAALFILFAFIFYKIKS